MIFIRSLAALVAMSLALAACQRKEDAAAAAAAPPEKKAPSATAERKEPSPEMRQMLDMLRAVYVGDAKYYDDHVLAKLADPDDPNRKIDFYVEPVAMKELPGGVFALVANSQYASDDGSAFSAHAEGGLLSVYLLDRHGEKWKVTRYFDHIATLGSFGHIGRVVWLDLAEGRPGFAVLHGGTWQGYSLENLSLFDLSDLSMHDLAEGIPLMSTSEGACVDETPECWTVEGKWRFEKNGQSAYDDFVIDFEGFREKRREGAGESAKRERSTLASKARYVYKDGKYALASGENIVPGI